MDKSVSRGELARSIVALPGFLRRRLRGGLWGSGLSGVPGGKLRDACISDMAPARTATILPLRAVDKL